MESMKNHGTGTTPYGRTPSRKTRRRGLSRRLLCVLLCVLLSVSMTGCTLSGDSIRQIIQSGFELLGFGDSDDGASDETAAAEPDGTGTEETQPSPASGNEGTVATGADQQALASHKAHEGLHRNNPNNYESVTPFMDVEPGGYRAQGSALELRGDAILIGVFVDTPKDPWKEKDLAHVSRNMDIACAWLEEQAKEHDVDLDIHYGEPNTTYHIRSDALSKDSTDTEAVFAFNKEVAHFLYNLDTKAIREKYGTDNVGFLLFLHEDYGAYTWPYVPTGAGLDRYYYNEFCCLFLYDGIGVRSYENPATYAHEILHLYGASDLYETNDKEGITQDLMQYVQTEYPHEIMYYTYEDDDTSNYDEITKMMSPFTLYFIGWDDGEEILKDWPKIKRKTPGAF